MIAYFASFRYPVLMRPQSAKALLRAGKTQAFLVTNPVNIRYLSGLSLSSGSILVTGSGFTLFTDARYLEMAQKKADKTLTVLDSSQLPVALAKVKECGVESEWLTLEQFRKLKGKYKNTKFVQNPWILDEFRRSKDEDEIRSFKKAQRITREMLRRVPALLRKPLTEKELAWQLELWAHELGADGLSFPAIVGFGTNTSIPHHTPTTRKLVKGHIVQIDVGAKFGGYCADQSQVFFTGKPTAFQRHVYNTLLEAKDAAIAAVKPGVTNHKLDTVAREILAREGMEEYFSHALGHGVGLEIHEGHSLSAKAPLVKLQKNEIVTIEPGVYFPGKFGMRVEEEIIVR